MTRKWSHYWSETKIRSSPEIGTSSSWRHPEDRLCNALENASRCVQRTKFSRLQRSQPFHLICTSGSKAPNRVSITEYINSCCHESSGMTAKFIP